MEIQPPINSDSIMTPIQEKRPEKKFSLYMGMLSASFFKTFGVGIGLAALLLVVGVVSDMSQKSSCNVSVRTLHGELNTYQLGIGDETDSWSLVSDLVRDDVDDSIKGIIVDIDSPGGYPVAGEEVAGALARLVKPNAAVIRSMGASAAYWAATGADQIFAAKSSDVGSIGVIVTFPDESEKNKMEGVAYNEFTSGTFKNLGTPTRPVTQDERALLERDVNEVFENFVAAVSLGRQMTIEKVRTIADGSSMTGVRAKQAGLIDAIGGIEEARVYIEKKIGVPAVLCESDAESFF